MKTTAQNRVLLALAALLLIAVYGLPLWSVRLVAPQYPEGLGLYIGVSEIGEHAPHDLQNINILNHYIGMRPIEPDAIPELAIMPLILGGLIVTGLLAAVIGRRWLMAAWLVAFAVLGIAGMVDFYQWKYDFGHNLSPDAAIKVPGMTYQPPLIGTKQLLNITASSYPYWGSLVLAVSALLAAVAVARSFRGGRETHGESTVPMPLPVAAAAALLLPVLAACGAPESGGTAAEPPEAVDVLVYGEDDDAYCGEPVDRVRWGGEVRTRDGAVFRFRSVECLAGFVLAGRVPPQDVARVRVVDFAHGWRLIEAATATYLHTPNLASPDRLNLLAVNDDALAVNLQGAYAGRLIAWRDVLELVAREWGIGRP